MRLLTIGITILTLSFFVSAQELMEIPIDDLAEDPGIIPEQSQGMSLGRGKSVQEYANAAHRIFKSQGCNVNPNARNYRLLLGRIGGEAERNGGTIDRTALNMYIRSYNNVLDIVAVIDASNLPNEAKAVLAQYYFDVASHPRFQGVEQSVEEVRNILKHEKDLYVGKLDSDRSIVKLLVKEYDRFRAAPPNNQRRLIHALIEINPHADNYVGHVRPRKYNTLTAAEKRELERKRFLDRTIKAPIELTSDEKKLDARYYVREDFDYFLLFKPDVADRYLR